MKVKYTKQTTMKIKNFVLAALILIPALSLTNDATAQRWERLGTRKVNYGLDHDVIKVNWTEGFFTKLKIVVTGGSLNMHRCVVHFENGSKQEIQLKYNFAKGSTSRVIDLKGNKRLIDRVAFWYDTKNFSGRKAKVTLFGRH